MENIIIQFVVVTLIMVIFAIKSLSNSLIQTLLTYLRGLEVAELKEEDMPVV